MFAFFVSCSESAEVFEPGEASFDAVAFSIEFFVMYRLLFSVGFGRHDCGRSHGLDAIRDGLTVVALVGQHPLGLSFAEQLHGLSAVVDLPSGDQKIHRTCLARLRIVTILVWAERDECFDFQLLERVTGRRSSPS